ncbi:helix-turn-helix transcriptional regulator [Aliiruegeria sabulilitoris]|uniref:helix-turn-helix transcriptional regulator n=1 Tax=Aliiruegeria sabulilitoris TaxID=1510458 RepID=UPI000835F3EA|nr:helix-turn-helix transcriptional regulator [Aliiruegeria sabulilitoris]NDR59446.1 helix-turn-helix domain-containing protein [Pseudoruegeria sp. M32A2M]
MARSSLTGSRIRERRNMVGRKQADLARAVGISPSYLNLIEHNRRRIGGKLINDIARELGVDAAALTEGAEAELLNTLREAAADHERAAEDLPRLEEFVGRFPGWARLLSDTRRRAVELEHSVEVLSDRMTHDPFLSTSLHEVISTVTAIRSTATILAETRDIDPEWRDRFHRNMAEESARLAESAEALVRYLDDASATDIAGSTPQEELDGWLRGRGFHIAELERSLALEPETLVNRSTELQSAAAREMGQKFLERYRKDAEHMPLKSFAEAATATGFDPAALSVRFGVDLTAVFRRLATLPTELVGAEIGLVTCDGSGTLTFRKPVEGFPLPRYSAACPLWPLYQALSRPMAPVRRRVEIGGRNPRGFVAYAVCQPAQPAGFDGPQVLEAAMLILPLEIVGAEILEPPQEVGTSCRICPRAVCAARREPSIMSEAF